MSVPLHSAILPQDHFEIKLPSDPQISPDGRFIAYTRTRADVANDSWITELAVIDRESGARHELGPAGQPCWAPDSKRLAFVPASEDAPTIALWHAGTLARSVLVTLPQQAGNLSWSPDGGQLAFVRRVAEAPVAIAEVESAAWANLRTPAWSAPGIYSDKLVRRVEGIDGEIAGGYHHIFLLDLDTGATRQLSDGPYQHGGPLTGVTKMTLAGHISWAPDGRHIVMSMQRPAPQSGVYDPKSTIAADVYEFAVADGAVRRLTDFGGPVCQASISPDGRWIAFVGFRNEMQSFHTNQLHLMPRDGGPVRTLPHPGQMEVHQQFQWLPDSSGLLMLLPDAGDGCIVRVSLDGEWRTLTRDVGGSAASGYVLYQKGFSVARDGHIAYLRGAATRTDEVAVLGADGAAGPTLSDESSWLAQRAVAPIEAMWLETRPGGPQWQAWMLRPAGAPADAQLPLIVWLHGGPYLAWCPHFALIPQIWAARGYAVLMMNPRGSLGYGAAFTQELQHDFPGQDDLLILDAVEAAVARGGIDPQRVHLAGESAGGVLTGWLIGHSQRFASASVIYGVLDWTSQVLAVDRPDYFPFYWLPGAPWKAGMQEQYWARSPLSLVDRVRTPTLVLCGERDWRTPVAQSEMYYTALKLCGVDAALVRYPDNNHSFEWHPSHWMDLVEHVDRWMREHSPAAAIKP
jgi:dipeptidyl aminopeptidase/acylaminoacyl peptidase